MEDLGTMEKMEKMTSRQHLVEDERWRRWTMEKMKMEKMEGSEMMKLCFLNTGYHRLPGVPITISGTRIYCLTKSKLDGQCELFINIIPEKATNTLNIIDSGVRMTRVDLVNNLGTITRSGTKEFMEAITVGVDESQVGGSFTLTRDTYGESFGRGTKMTLYLKEDQLEYLEERRLKDL
ncbi:heat shock protein 90, partial [Tanacetum coccineum]